MGCKELRVLVNIIMYMLLSHKSGIGVWLNHCFIRKEMGSHDRGVRTRIVGWRGELWTTQSVECTDRRYNNRVYWNGAVNYVEEHYVSLTWEMCSVLVERSWSPSERHEVAATCMGAWIGTTTLLQCQANNWQHRLYPHTVSYVLQSACLQKYLSLILSSTRRTSERAFPNGFSGIAVCVCVRACVRVCVRACRFKHARHRDCAELA